MNSLHFAPRALTVALALALSLGACSRGQGRDDTLADGAIDRPTASNGATDVGPGAPPVDSAGPGVGNSASQPAAGSGAGPSLVLVPQGPQGAYIANGAGNSLYYVEGDADGTACTGACEASWPPVIAAGLQPSGGPGLQGAMIATVTRPDGSRQVTFNGHPLYRYAADTAAGRANGDGVKDKYGTWHLATPTMAAGGAKGGSGTAGAGATDTQAGAAR